MALAAQATRLARNSVFNLLGHGLPLIVGLATMPMVVRALGAERFGVLSLTWVVLGYAAIFDLGLSRAVTKYLAELHEHPPAHERAGRIFWTASWLQLILGALGGGVFALATPAFVTSVLGVPGDLHAEAVTVFLIISASVPLILLFNTARAALEAVQRFDIVNYVRAPLNSLNFLVPFLCVVLGYGLVTITVLLVVLRAAGTLALGLLAMRAFPALHTRPHYDRGEARLMLGFGGWVTASSTVSPLLMYLDRFVLGAIMGVAAVGYYSAPYDVVVRLIIIPGSLAAALFPALSAAAARRDNAMAGLLVARTVKYLLMMLGPIAIVLMTFSYELLAAWLGTEFAREGALALQILALGVLVNGLAMIPYTMLQAVGRPDIPAKFHLVELPLQALLAYAFVSAWGIPGAALAWLARVAIDAALLFLALSRVCAVDHLTYRRGGLWPSLAALGTIGIVGVTGSFLLSMEARLAVAALAAAPLLLFLWRVGLDGAERSALHQFMTRRTVRSQS